MIVAAQGLTPLDAQLVVLYVQPLSMAAYPKFRQQTKA